MKFTSNIAYEVQEGKGTPIVLLHGLCEDLHVWDEFIGAFSEKHVIRIDLPGFGASELYGNGSIRAMAEAIHKVLQKEQVTKSVMVGHSMGGYVALEYARKFPERLAGLGLFHSHPYEDTHERKLIRRKTIAHIEDYGTKTYLQQLFGGLATPEFSINNSNILNALIDRALSIKAGHIANALEALRTRRDNTEVLRSSIYPVLFILGAKDQITPIKVSLPQVHLPNCTDIHILPNVAHLGMYEAPEVTQTILKHFVALCDTLL